MVWDKSPLRTLDKSWPGGMRTNCTVALSSRLQASRLRQRYGACCDETLLPSAGKACGWRTGAALRGPASWFWSRACYRRGAHHCTCWPASRAVSRRRTSRYSFVIPSRISRSRDRCRYRSSVVDTALPESSAPIQYGASTSGYSSQLASASAPPRSTTRKSLAACSASSGWCQVPRA